ncbi:uncharacterized protein BJ212DRAFT_1302492 [Suillus subaureus]|uniref:Uncharacterized protein n=1 Tax=Suillus subaureus TaxID=48587 RepID=A0A9P7E366_9AGAM|nr:uncharacterized protein BJ212DRAFT_1302492 [Suillus subaureus]KAG1809654.1 hypothetical protein BJ212DRAFT_1302492 [Suillus subaureus]
MTHFKLVLLCVSLYFVGVIQAAPTTITTTDDSSEALSFTTRTIWTIISSSVLTLFACIYSTIHPNIPSPKDSPLLILWRRLGIMLMALIAPELIVTWAMRQWFSARQVTRQFKKSGYPSVRPEPEESDHGSIEAPSERYAEVSTSKYEGTHTLTKPFRKLFEVYVSEQSEDYTWTQEHSFFALMGGFMLYVDGKPYHTLQPDDILKLIRAGCIDAPTLTVKQIHDKSKSNGISKGLTVLQVAWFVMQLITRAIYHFETTQLEVGTLAFAVLNFLTYAVWWNKPLNVQCPHPVYWKSTESRPEDHLDIPESNQVAGWGILFPVCHSIEELISSPGLIPTSRKLRVPTFDGSIELEASNLLVLLLAGFLMVTIFGGIHCMAWFFAFPTHEEQVLWRMSSAAITCTPWFGFLTLLLSGGFPVYAVLYTAGRVTLLVLMFTTLRNLPPDAYKAVSWTSLVPHL